MEKREKWPFYRAFDSKVGDVMPCYFNDKFYIYYLRFGEYGDGAYNEWSVRETADFVHFSEDRRIGLYGGTGEILPWKGRYHAFKEAEANQIGHWIGDTPYGFEDTGERIAPDPRWYVDWAWRDPKIIWAEKEKCWWMLLAANENTGNKVRRHGCVALLKSKDLHHWEQFEPLYAPRCCEGTFECPDMFRMGEWWYLLYSTAQYNKMTHYVKGKTMYGPWQMPEDDTIDSFLFYAGRTACDGTSRYVAAWNADRTGRDLAMKIGLRDVVKTEMVQWEDLAPFGYGGDMVIHLLGQRENGDLTCGPVPGAAEKFDTAVPFAFRPLQGKDWEQAGNSVSVNSPGLYSCALAAKLPERYLASMTVRGTGHEFGIAIGADETFFGKGLFLRFQPGMGRVQAVSGVRDDGWTRYCMPFAVEMEKFVSPDTQGAYHVQIMQDGEVIALYVNGQALSLRSCNTSGGCLGLYAFDADMSFEDIRISRAEDITEG